MGKHLPALGNSKWRLSFYGVPDFIGTKSHIKQMQHQHKFLSLSVLISMVLVFLCVMLLGGPFSMDARAEVRAAYLYTLSGFQGAVPLNWATLTVDRKRHEIYALDPRARDIRIFNESGMEIYRFGDDNSLGTALDVAIKPDGNILVLSRRQLKSLILVCNYRGEVISELEIKDLPPDFSTFSPDRMAFRHERLYLLDSGGMRIAVTDSKGLFQKGYDLAALLDVEEEKRAETEISGFSVDREGNMLFTVAVFFAAYTLSPDGKVTGWGQSGSAPGRFNIVGGIVADKKGNYYVADRLKSAVLIFDRKFKFLKEFGYRGGKPENLIGPRHLAIDHRGRLYVSQLRSRGVSVFRITHRSP